MPRGRRGAAQQNTGVQQLRGCRAPPCRVGSPQPLRAASPPRPPSRAALCPAFVLLQGDYDTFERTMRERVKNAKSAAESQDMKRKHMQAGGAAGGGLVAAAAASAVAPPRLRPLLLLLLLLAQLQAPIPTHRNAVVLSSYCNAGWIRTLPFPPFLQAFIDKFRYNANRAALVQSRIKALERLAGGQGSV